MGEILNPLPARKMFRINTRLVWLVGLVPLAVLIYRAIRHSLTANPIEFVSQYTGWWTLLFMMISLSVTPMRQLFNAPGLFPLRRTFGLITFTYAALHFLTWLVLEQFFDWSEMMHDLSDRPFIYVGFIAFFGLFSLALTSNKRTKIYMGPKRWKRLHQAVYFVAILGVIHFYILVKSSDVTEPLLFASVLFLLLGFRLFEYFRR